MNYVHSYFYILFTISFLIDSIYSGTRKYTSGTIYDNSYYIDLFRVQNNWVQSLFSPGCTKASLNNLLDNNYNNYWVSQEEGTKVRDSTTGQTYNPLKVNLTFTFNRVVSIDKMIYQANSIGSSSPVGFPEELNIYYTASNDDNFVLLDQIKSVATDKKVVFIFSKSVNCRKINLEWKKISESKDSNYKNKGTAKEIIFLYPETKNINSTLINAFDKSDYRELTLSKDWKNISNIKNLSSEVNNYFVVGGFNIFNNVSRILSIYMNNLKYDPKREFSTVEYKMSPINHLKQFGDIESYARNTLKMSRGGTNRQSTGIYAQPRQIIYIYVKAERNTEPLPTIQFSQFIGNRSNWLGSPKKLKLGKNILIADDFEITNNYEIATYPGGPIYISNPYNSSQQGEITVYIEGGVVFPTYRINTNETAYKEILEEWINLVNKDDKIYPDITEFFSNRLILTVKATHAYKIYSQKYSISPQPNLAAWDNYLKNLFTFDGIQFNTNDPYYNIKNNYVNLHIRYAQPYGGGYAGNQHIGIFGQDWIDNSLNFSIKTIGWGFPHEIGHMMDIPERTVVEYSNNMIAKYYYFVLLGNTGEFITDSMKNKIEFLTKDNIDNKLRGCQSSNQADCKGFLYNTKYNYFIFWDLECYLHGYWSKLDNMYRYNNTLPSGIKKDEKFVYFSSIILKLDLGYYFSRWGLSFDGGNTVFDENKTTNVYNDLMNAAEKNGLISRNIQKKFWYYDLTQYDYYGKVGPGCYADKTKYNVQIVEVTKKGENEYVIELPTFNCPHLGYEIYETNTLIGFTTSNTYTDKTVYNSGYKPKYKIIGYDRLLKASKESEYKTYTNANALKSMNLRGILSELN